MQISSNETTPSDHEDVGEEDDDDEEHMDETDFSLVKNLLHNSNTLDNRKSMTTTAANVFCCGDKNGTGVIGKLLGHNNNNQQNKKKQPTGPGQAVQVITNESGITEVVLEDNEVSFFEQLKNLYIKAVNLMVFITAEI